MTPNRRKYDDNILRTWWDQSSLWFKIILAVLPTIFAAGVIYAGLTSQVNANTIAIGTLKTKQDLDHDTLIQVSQGIADLKTYWSVPNYHEVKR